MYLGKYEHELRVVLIKAWRGELPHDEAVAEVRNVFSKLQDNLESGKGRAYNAILDLCGGSITVNEAEREILFGE